MVDFSGIFGRGHKSDLSTLLSENEVPMVKFCTFFQQMHNFYFGSLRVESQEHKDLEALLWQQCAISVDQIAESTVQVVPENIEKLMINCDANPGLV